MASGFLWLRFDLAVPKIQFAMMTATRARAETSSHQKHVRVSIAMAPTDTAEKGGPTLSLKDALLVVSLLSIIFDLIY